MYGVQVAWVKMAGAQGIELVLGSQKSWKWKD
jgi:hypothetical protein